MLAPRVRATDCVNVNNDAFDAICPANCNSFESTTGAPYTGPTLATQSTSFHITTGGGNGEDCRLLDVDTENCITNRPPEGNYNNYGYCNITVLQPGLLRTEIFATESSYDTVTVRGDPSNSDTISYSGVLGPAGVVVDVGGVIQWESDGSVAEAGWTTRAGYCKHGGAYPTAQQKPGSSDC